MVNENRYKELQKISVLSIILNILLTVFKIIIGVLSKSTAVISDAVHTLSDIFTTIAVMIGIKLSSREADTDHPYGHQKIESIISLFLSFILTATAVYLGYFGISTFLDNGKINPSWPALFITVVSMALKEYMYRFTIKKARQYNSSSLASDAWHHRSDALSSLAVLVGVGGVFLGFDFLEPAATVVMCFIILKVSVDIIKDSVKQLIDYSADNELCRKIENLVLSVKDVKKIDLLKTRISNNVIFVELEIAIESNMTVGEGHHIAQSVHDLLENSIPLIEHCMVHVNPI